MDLKNIIENDSNKHFQNIHENNTIFYLIFATFLNNLKIKHFPYLMDLCQEQFK